MCRKQGSVAAPWSGGESLGAKKPYLCDMDIAGQKEEIIRRFLLVDDLNIISAFERLLDTDGIEKKEKHEIALQASINRAMEDSRNGRVRPVEEMMAETRKRFAL